jgi:hypothetical protein
MSAALPDGRVAPGGIMVGRVYDERMQRAYIGSVRALSFVLILLGLVMIVLALARGGGVLALGVLVGVCFTLAGAGRLWLMRSVRGEPR